jgi:hydrogenase maturation protease
MKRITLLGLGNVLMGDDGFGPYALAWLQAGWEFGPGVSAVEGTPGLDLTVHLADLDALIVIDTVRAGGAAGETRLYRREQILEMPASPWRTPHDPGLRQALGTLEFWGRAPREVLLVGVVPARVDLELGLSAEVQAALPQVEAEVVRELQRLDASVRRRSQPLAPDLWWEAQSCTS